MIKHIVFWRLKETDPAAREKTARQIKVRLESLQTKIPQIQKIFVGSNVLPGDTASDLALVSEFASLADLQIYQTHPEHQAVAQFVKSVVAERRVVDFECA